MEACPDVLQTMKTENVSGRREAEVYKRCCGGADNIYDLFGYDARSVLDVCKAFAWPKTEFALLCTRSTCYIGEKQIDGRE